MADMLTALVHRYTGTLPLLTSPLAPYADAIWLEVRHPAWPEHERRLGGYDNYWADPTSGRFGCFNDPWNREWYDGPQALAWIWDADGQREHPDVNAPPTAVVVRGVMIPDAIAHQLGLI